MKVLIFFKEKDLLPVGGPAGYLYNVKIERDKEKDDELFFLNSSIMKKGLIRSGVDKIVYFIIKLFLPTYWSSDVYIKKYKSKMKGLVDFSKFDIVHFHGTFEMYSQRRALKNYRGKVVLQVHSPRAYFKDHIDSLPQGEYLKYKRIFDSTEDFDMYAFSRADYLIFPCEGAEEPYFHTWDKYENLRKDKKIIYLPTGINKEVFRKTPISVREELNIPQDAFVISFVGRHIAIKGYDILIDMFNRLDNIYIVCCGRLGDIIPPNSERWIEVGWTDDAYSYVNASDLFINTNRETYFDLSILQTLSIGKTALISYTGGNKYFEDMEDKAIYTYKTITQAVEIIKRIQSEPREDKLEKESKQVEYFNNNFDIKYFYKKYKKILKELVNDFEN